MEFFVTRKLYSIWGNNDILKQHTNNRILFKRYSKLLHTIADGISSYVTRVGSDGGVEPSSLDALLHALDFMMDLPVYFMTCIHLDLPVLSHL